MKTFSLILSLFLVVMGLFLTIYRHNYGGIIPVIVGSLAFLIVVKKTKKIDGYNATHWMNR